MRSTLALGCLILAALLLIVTGVTYLTRSEFMPYHALAVGRTWADLEPPTQALVLALLRLAGGGFLSAGLSVLILTAFPLRRGQPWARWAILLVGLSWCLPMLSATFLVESRTPAWRPLAAASGMVVLLVLGTALFRASRAPLDHTVRNRSGDRG